MIQKPLKILLIEDNPDDVVLLRHYLAQIPSARIEIELVGRLAAALECLGEKAARDRRDSNGSRLARQPGSRHLL